MKKSLEAASYLSPVDKPASKRIYVLPDAVKTQLGQACKQLIDQNLGNRGSLDNDLDIWNAILEMRAHGSPNLPWDGASQIVTPTVFSEYQEFCSRVTGATLVPRPYTVHGNDPISAQYAHAVEQFMNSEWDENNSFEPHEKCIRLGARDGTAIMEVLYELSTHEERWVSEEPTFDSAGQPVMDESTGQQKTHQREFVAKFVDYDAPRETPVDLKSFLLLPNFETTINGGDGCARKVFLTEKELDKKIAAGIFDPDAVERCLGYVSTAQGEVSTDPQGNSQLTVNNRISVVDYAIAPPEGVRMYRGPLLCWRLHTDLFDLDDDGVPEENIIWIHYNSGEYLGHVPYEYPGGRPFFPLTMIPRTDVLYGFAVPEIGRSSQEEVDAQTNGRLNLLDLAQRPQRYATEGVKKRDAIQRFDPDTVVEMTQKGDYGFIDPPNIPQGSIVEEDRVTQRFSRAVGSPQAPSAGGPIGGQQQRSARAAQFQAQIMAMNANLVNTRVRRWMLDIFRFKYGLYQRYGKNQLETVATTQEGKKKVVIPREILSLDYTLGVSGLGGALDKETRRTEMATITQLALQFFGPLFQGKPTRLWNFARMVFETYDMPDVTSLIGTLDEAKAQEQAQAEAQQTAAQMEMIKQVVSHQSKGSGGQPTR